MNYVNFKGDKGFTLVEIILTIAILAIAFVPALGYFSNSINMVSEIEQRDQAIKIATDIMENIKFDLLSDWDNVDDEDYSLAYIDSGYSLGTSDFKVDADIEDLDDGFRKITVTISWNDTNNDIELNSLVVKR